MKAGRQEGYQQGVAAEAGRMRQSRVRQSVGETGSATPPHPRRLKKAPSAANKQYNGYNQINNLF